MSFFFFNDTATTEIYTLSLHDALPIFPRVGLGRDPGQVQRVAGEVGDVLDLRHLVVVRQDDGAALVGQPARSEEHTSELQSRQYLVCRLLLEKKKSLSDPMLCCNQLPP